MKITDIIENTILWGLGGLVLLLTILVSAFLIIDKSKIQKEKQSEEELIQIYKSIADKELEINQSYWETKFELYKTRSVFLVEAKSVKFYDSADEIDMKEIKPNIVLFSTDDLIIYGDPNLESMFENNIVEIDANSISIEDSLI
jgi:predicted small secreted protein